MSAQPLRPVKRYRPGKALPEDQSSEEEEDEDEVAQEEERRKLEEAERRRKAQQARSAPKATSFPATATSKVAKGVKDVTLEDEDEEGFVTEEEEEAAKPSAIQRPAVAGHAASATVESEEEDDDDEEESEEEESSEEESSEDEAPRRVLLRPTFIKKDKRKGNEENAGQPASAPGVADTVAEAEARRAQRQEKADFLVRDQLEKEAMSRLAGKKAWDEDENVAAEEEALDDRDGAAMGVGRFLSVVFRLI